MRRGSQIGQHRPVNSCYCAATECMGFMAITLLRRLVLVHEKITLYCALYSAHYNLTETLTIPAINKIPHTTEINLLNFELIN